MTPEHLLERVAQQRTPGDYLYLLLDPLAGYDPEHSLSLSELTQALGEQAIELVTRADLANLAQECPVLVQLAAPGQPSNEYLRLSARNALREVDADRRYICGWLLSEQPPTVIAQHLVERCLALLPVSGQAMAPWFEPVRLELLHDSMRTISDVLWPLSAWFYPTACGAFDGVLGYPFEGDLVIPHSVREMQYLAPHILNVLGAWRLLNQSPPTYAPWAWKGHSSLPPKAPFHIYRLMANAWKRKLSNIDDLHCLCLHQVMIHPLLLDHPTLQQDFKQAVAGEQSLVSRFSTYDDHTWSRIVAALPQARSYS